MKNNVLWLFMVVLGFSNHGMAKPFTDNPWWQGGQKALQTRLGRQYSEKPGSARNVIVFVGDGMSLTTVTAARILAGQTKGGQGEEYQLSFERFPFTALAKTYNVNQQTPDSAGTMTAIATGVKTHAGVLGVSENVTRGLCRGIEQNTLPSFIELAETQGRATGIVTTARLTHATPAATYAKSPERDWEDDSQMPPAASDLGCHDIATQFVQFAYGDGIDVALGGGRRHFLPSPQGKRLDQQNLVKQWQARYPQGAYVQTGAELAALSGEESPVLGLFSDSHMQFDRDNDGREPSLVAMTNRALDVLQRNPKGYVLLVEAGRIDHAHHAGNAYHALHDTLALHEAVSAVLKRVNLAETLVLVTADHSHVFTMAGYPTRGNPILGYVVGNDGQGHPESQPAVAGDGLHYTTLGYHNGPGAGLRESLQAGGGDMPDPEKSGYQQHAAVPMQSESHGGDDVPVYAVGPNSHLVTGVMEQNVIFHLLDYAAGLSSELSLDKE